MLNQEKTCPSEAQVIARDACHCLFAAKTSDDTSRIRFHGGGFCYFFEKVRRLLPKAVTERYLSGFLPGFIPSLTGCRDDESSCTGS